MKWLKAPIVVPAGAAGSNPNRTRVYVIAHTHGTVSGWLAPFQTERNYVVNNHVDHLRHLAQSPQYSFACSEVPNLIALKQLRPDAFQTLESEIAKGRAELVNAFFLEPTINLTMGETLLRLGVEGQRWYRDVFGQEPLFAWMIDVVGVHSQMPAIVDHLGLQAMVYSRNCPGSTLHWWESPSGARTLAVALGADCYINWRLLFSETEPFKKVHIQHLHKSLQTHLEFAPEGMPVLWLVAGGDYGHAPVRQDQIERLLTAWSKLYPEIDLVFDETPSHFLAECQKALETHSLPVVRGDNLFSYNAFWVNNPAMKQAFRQAETKLLSLEAAVALLSAADGRSYPAHALQQAWHLLFLNADRGLLWGIGSGDAFYGDASWTAQDRFTMMGQLLDGMAADMHDSDSGSYFNSLANFSTGPFRLQLPSGKRLAGTACDAWGGEEVVIPSFAKGMGFFPAQLEEGPQSLGQQVDLPGEIITEHYRAKICPNTGDLVSLRLPERRPLEILSGPANRLRFERQPDVDLKEDFIVPRAERLNVDCVLPDHTRINCRQDEMSLVVEVQDALVGGGAMCRRMRFFNNHPIIDADIELTDVPEDLLVSLGFPLSIAINAEARAVPFGFSERDPRSPPLPPDPLLMFDHATYGTNAATVPAIGWSWHGNAAGHGLGLLDRGVPGRESHGHTASLLLMNTSKAFRNKPNQWLSGAGRHCFRYSLHATARGWRDADLPAHAAMLNMPLRFMPGVKERGVLLRTSSNLSVQSVRRDGRMLEVRCVESLGHSGAATVQVGFRHLSASRGNARKPMAQLSVHEGRNDGTDYVLEVMPQEIITLRFETEGELPYLAPLSGWDDLVPQHKRAGLSQYDPDLIGHPPE